MIKKKGKMTIVGTTSGAGWDCMDSYQGSARTWGVNDDICDQRWNNVAAHMDWITKVIKGKGAEQCEKGGNVKKASSPQKKKIPGIIAAIGAAAG